MRVARGWDNLASRNCAQSQDRQQGLRGRIDAIRDLIVGANDRSYLIAFEIPEISSPDVLERFLKLF